MCTRPSTHTQGHASAGTAKGRPPVTTRNARATAKAAAIWMAELSKPSTRSAFFEKITMAAWATAEAQPQAMPQAEPPASSVWAFKSSAPVSTTKREATAPAPIRSLNSTGVSAITMMGAQW